MPENKMTRDELHARITQAPFHQWLGLEVTGADEEGIDVRIPWRDEFVVNVEVGYAHGGILATVIDVVGDFALAAKLGRPYPTVDMRVDFHRAAMPGDMHARGQVVKLGKMFSVAETSVHDSNGKLLASGRAVYAVAAPK